MTNQQKGSDFVTTDQLDIVYGKLKELSHDELRKLVVKLLEENEQLKRDILIDDLTKIYKS